jgi:hypothetical protein
MFALLASAVVGVTAGCGGVKSTTTTTSTTTTPTTPSTPGAKSPLVGLVAMGQQPFVTNPALTPDNTMEEPNANPNVYVAAVINVTWKQLQPNNGTTLDTSAIEAGLSAIATYNAMYPSHKMVGKLRIFSGLNAPVWALNLDGAPVTGTLNGVTGSIPRFWTANYQAAWTALQTQLAAVYDKDSRLGEVAVSGCSARTAEPFIESADATTIPLYKADGYTDAQMEACLSNMGTQYAGWTETPLDYTFNAFTHIDTGVDVTDTVFPIQVMMAWRAALGTGRGVIANHGLQPTLTASATPLYAEFSVLGPPIEFQTYGPSVDWNATIALGLTYKPTEIEIWTTTQGGGQAVISSTQLQTWAGEI